MEKVCNKYDPALLGMLQDCGSINGFLENIFSFLMRRTDFYRHPTKEKPKFGFPPGAARKMVENAFLNYEVIMKQTLLQIDSLNHPVANANIQSDHKPHREIPIGVPQATNEDLNGPIYLADSECYNGANRDKYSWSQKINELDIIIKIPKEIKSSKKLDVKITKDSIDVKSVDGIEIINEKLCWPIKHNDVTWSFDPKENKLILACDKQDERWWDALFLSEEKLDTSKIDCSRPITDLSEEAQAKIAQMKFDQEQKQKGLPTSEEQRVQNILKEAWNLEGSPFKGQEFDPSLLNISSK